LRAQRGNPSFDARNKALVNSKRQGKGKELLFCKKEAKNFCQLGF